MYIFSTEGVNAILPNLDLVFVGAKLCELEGLNTAFHVLVILLHSISVSNVCHFLVEQSVFFW